jgi:hypothetical protein
LVLAHPLDGTALVLGPTACFVWFAIDSSTSDELTQVLATEFPDVLTGDLVAALDEILTLLLDAGLVKVRSGSQNVSFPEL